MTAPRDKDVPVADAAQGNWVDRLAPSVTRPWLRLMRADRPVGIWLLYWPCVWSILLANPQDGPEAAFFLILFLGGAAVMRGAGCVINDILDRDIDAQVERTASRPLPSGQVSVLGALVFLIGLLLIGLAILLQLNLFAIVLGAVSLGPVALYPLAKRVTWWPQAVLGLTFNWGALLGWAAVRGDLGWAPVALYLGALFWTLGYDTIYAHQDKADDAIVGVKSTALRLGEATPQWVSVFYGFFVVLTALAGTLAGLHWLFYLALGPMAAHLVWQIRTLDLEDGDQCLKVFKSNQHVGALLAVACFIGIAV